MTIHTNSGLVLAMESARDAEAALEGITNANPGVLTDTAHALTNGDIVYYEVEGMIQLNGRLFETINTTANTWELKNTETGSVGIDTTSFGVYTNGTYAKVTLGTTIPGVQEFSPSGGEPKFVDTTTVSDLQDKQIVVGVTAMSYAMTMQWDPSDAAQKAMLAAYEVRASKAFKITWPGGRYTMFVGTVGYAGAAGGTPQGVTTSPAAISLDGAPTHGIP